MKLRPLFKVTIDREDLLLAEHTFCLLGVDVAYDIDGGEIVIESAWCSTHSTAINFTPSEAEMVLNAAIHIAQKQRLFEVVNGKPVPLEVF